jgi:hypothetical protein
VLRSGLCRDLGFSESDREENIRRAGEVARVLSDAGLTVIAAFITPLDKDKAGPTCHSWGQSVCRSLPELFPGGLRKSRSKRALQESSI